MGHQAISQTSHTFFATEIPNGPYFILAADLFLNVQWIQICWIKDGLVRNWLRI
jgi:hypothetical protein